MKETQRSVEEAVKEKRQFSVIKTGGVYKLPCFKVIAGVGLEKTKRTVDIPIVRGSRIENGKEIFSIEGTTNETLLCVVLEDLERKFKVLPEENTHNAILHIQTAIGLLERREYDRIQRGVIATNQK